MMLPGLIDYLCSQRNIDTNVVSGSLDEGKIYADRCGNGVFVGFDENRQPRFTSMYRADGNYKPCTNYEGSDDRYSFCMEVSTSSRLYIFENPIDAISHASLEIILADEHNAWRQDHRLSLAGTSDTALPLFLETHPHVREFVFCLSNNPVGRDAAISIARKYATRGFYTRLELPKGTNYSEDLLVMQTFKFG